jgi:hypothetical protein
MRNLILVLTGLLLAATTAVSAQEVAQPSLPPLSAICANAFLHASSTLPSASEQPGDAEASAVPLEADASPAPGDPAYLDYVVKRCPSLDEWLAGAEAYPEVLAGQDPMTFLGARCDDPASGLAQYAACTSLAHALATPPPTPTPTLAPNLGASPAPSAWPTPPGSVDARGPGPDAGLTRVPDGRIPVPGADRVHHFRVKGATQDELTRSIARQVRKFCRTRDVMACVEPRGWRFVAQTAQDPDTGTCTITGVIPSVSLVAHVPRWTAPDRVNAALAWWWRKLAIRTQWFEAQHVAILQEHIAKLPGEVVGRPCSEFDPIVTEWTRALEQARDAFNAVDAPRRGQASRLWLRQAYRR